MEEQEIINIAKEAYILSKQLGALEEGLKERKNVSGYRSYAENYNKILARAKQLLQNDEIIFKSIQHLKPYDSSKNSGYAKEFIEMAGDVLILKEALYTFFEFHFPKKEKEKIGFRFQEDDKSYCRDRTVFCPYNHSDPERVALQLETIGNFHK